MIELIPFSAPTYWLNFTGHMAVSSGAQMGDVEHAIAPYLDHVVANRDRFQHAKDVAPLTFDGAPAVVPAELAADMLAAIPIWTEGWIAEGERLAGVAERFLEDGETLTAAGIFHRASVLVGLAEWSMLVGDEKRDTFDRARELCDKAMEHGGVEFERVRIPYEGHQLDGMFFAAPDDGPRPTAVCFNGLHSSMEWFWQNGLVDHLRRRGISVFVFDCPGSGSARFHLDLHMEPATEKYAGPAVDHVLSRTDVDPDRLVAVGCSFGGYRTVRAAANDERFKVCLAWGALYEIPAPPTGADGSPNGVAASAMNGLDAETIMWFMGIRTADDIGKVAQFTLAEQIAGLTSDLVIFHGANDQQVPVEQARRVFNEAVNARSRELHVYTAADGGDQHCHLDNPATALGHMTDRVATLLNS